eukprot:gene32884-37141_t
MGGLGEAVCIKLAALGYKVVTTYSPSNKKVDEWLATTRATNHMFDNIEIARPKPSLRGGKRGQAGGDMADLLVAYLEQIGTDYVFAVPGGAIEPLYDAISRNLRKGGTLRHIVARHEAGAAFMADGYARETGRIGVCAATSGPGATNMLTAVATAYGNGVAMLVITGQPALLSFGRHGLQESACTGIDVLAMFRHCTRYNSL